MCDGEPVFEMDQVASAQDIGLQEIEAFQAMQANE